MLLSIAATSQQAAEAAHTEGLGHSLLPPPPPPAPRAPASPVFSLHPVSGAAGAVVQGRVVGLRWAGAG